MSVVEEVRRYTRQHYGNLISVGEPEFNARTKTWVVELKSDYPRIIPDDRMPSKKIMKFLSLRQLGKIKLGESLQPIEATSRDICLQNLSSFLEMWQERAERIIVRASSDHFAQINETQWVLAKVGMIISNLLQKNIISNREIEFYPPKEKLKLRRYLRLLEGLNLVKEEPNGYSYGNLFTELLDKAEGNIQDFKTAVLSHIIRKRYFALKESFGISQLETFVHVDSCYYKPALEAEELPYWTRDSIINHYMKIYGRKSPLRIAYILGELVDVKALEYEDKFYFGNQKLFSQMLRMKSEMGQIAPLRA
jgi:hypothetical protein